jgi:nucleoside-diphosphate-sugar epimerase
VVHDTLFVTGGGGLIGRELLAAVAADGDLRVRALSRSPRAPGTAQGAVSGAAVGESESGAVEWVQGDLLDPAPWMTRLEGCRAILHLGASTGRASAAVHRAVNLEATRALVRAARDARVARFVFVSSIAATYPEVTRYPYAAAKQEAEHAVRVSSLDWTVLRPTIVLGSRGGPGPALAAFARRSRTPIFGPGLVRVQPLGAADCARLILESTRDPGTSRQSIDLGGPDVLTFRELLVRLRTAQGQEGERFLQLPLGPALWAAWGLERLLGPRLPVLAGQLYPFRYDSTAQPSSFLDARMPLLSRIDAVLAGLVRELGAAAHG